MADFSTSQSVTHLTDFVLSDDGKLAYLTTSDGKLLRWDVQGNTFLAPITLGGDLSTVDLSADGSYLLVGRHDVINGNTPDAWWDFVGHTIIDGVQTDTFAVTPLDLTVTGMERGVASIALVAGNMALADNTFAGSGWVPLHYFSPTSSPLPATTAPGTANVRHDTYLIPSADNRYVFIQEADSSNAPMRIYDTQTNSQIASNDMYALGSSGFNSGIGDINSKSRLVVNVVSGHIYVLDFQLRLVKDFTSLMPADFIIGAQFSGDGEHLMLWSDQNRQLRVFETRTWTEVSTVALQGARNNGGSPYVGGSDVSADGHILFLDNAAGFEIVDLQSKLSINLTGGGGADNLYGSVGVDTLSGGDGNDTLHGGDSADVLSGGNGDDLIEGGGGDDVIDGGAGNDTASYESSAARAIVSLAVTGPQITGAGSDSLINIENLTGSMLDDFLVGNAGNNILSGLDGSDTLVGGAGDDILNGGAGGPDRAEFSDATSGVTVSLAVTGPQSVGGGLGSDTLLGIEGLIGSQYDDTLTGDAGANYLRGASGNDYLVGGAGNDILYGDAPPGVTGFTGNDILMGGAGDDTLFGGAGIDEATYASATGGVTVDLTQTIAQAVGGGGGSDTLSGIENLTGSAFNDILVGDAGANVLRGYGGDDILEGGDGDDVLDGGNDVNTARYQGATSGVTVSLAIGGPQNTGGAGTDSLISILNLTGSAFDDTLTGDDGANVLDGGLGDDTLNGGSGLDTASYASATSAVNVNLRTGKATGGAGSDTLIAIQNVTGSAYADSLTSAASGSGSVLRGMDGDDVFYFGAPAPDAAPAETFDGGAGMDMISLASATSAVTASLSTGHLQTPQNEANFTGIEGIIGSGYGDTLTGDAGANVLIGGDGNDTLNGGAGGDRLYGGVADDIYVVDTQSDLIFELAGEGTDTVVTTASYYLYDNVEDLTLSYLAGDIFGVGNALANKIAGNAGDNLILGGAGNDTLTGLAGADQLYGEDGDDTLTGGAGLDWLVGGAGNDTLDGAKSGGAGEQDLLFGGAGDDHYLVDAANDLTFEATNGGTDTVTADIAGGGYYLYANVENLILAGTTINGVGNELDNVITGNASANWLLGGAGNDTLNGKAGNDVLFGQDGADTFIFEHGTGGDVIGDFTVGVDKIQLTGIYASFAEVQSHMVQNGGDSAIDLGQGDLVVFQHVAMSAFTAGDFLF